jgi:Virulence protein RhuM family
MTLVLAVDGQHAAPQFALSRAALTLALLNKPLNQKTPISERLRPPVDNPGQNYIAGDFRMISMRTTQFSQWAMGGLMDFAIRGYVLDKERLKNPDQPFESFEALVRRVSTS